MLNKSKGNMYGFVTHTWNPIKGKCPHECSYCYMKRFPQGELRLDEKCFKDNLGEGNYIFVGSSTDMWYCEISIKWIEKVLMKCKLHNSNTYLFQSKNPYKFDEIFSCYHKPDNIILGTTIETNRAEFIADYSDAPENALRIFGMENIRKYEKMLTVEPIMDFDIKDMLMIIKRINPFQVNIGADSGHNNLPEPPKEKIEALITELKKFIKVHLKDNLGRLLE